MTNEEEGVSDEESVRFFQESHTMRTLASLTLAILFSCSSLYASNAHKRKIDELIGSDSDSDSDSDSETFMPISAHVALGQEEGGEPYIPEDLVPHLKTFVSPCDPEKEMDQFIEPLAWYRPTPEELTSITTMGFEPRHLGAALRMRAHLTLENTPLLKGVLKDSDIPQSQRLLPAAMGLSNGQLRAAAKIENIEERLNFLINAQREDAWIFGMLGADPILDNLAINANMRARVLINPDKMSSFFIRNLKEGTNITRMRFTGFLSELTGLITDKLSRANRLGFEDNSHVMETVKKKGLPRPFSAIFWEMRLNDGKVMPRITIKKPDYLDPMPLWTYKPSTYLDPIP
ncbi:MAG: hypothetical protein C0514_02315 [Candidatus Puniceispirillum sp.]|nr:hypothetical protein [Candidatus Puniceispirillum sp.]